MKRASVSVHPKVKKKIGRPATGRDPAVTSRIPPKILEKVTAWAKTKGHSRSVAIVYFLARGLISEDQMPEPKSPSDVIRELLEQANAAASKRKGKA
jgi:hypothetical protein